MFANNDVEVPNGAITILDRALSTVGVTVVVPLTSRRGAGHNPAQDLLIAHRMDLLHISRSKNSSSSNNMSSSLDEYVEEPSNCEAIQSALTLMHTEVLVNKSIKYEASTNKGVVELLSEGDGENFIDEYLPVSSWNNKVKFNGFFFGVNLRRTRPVVFSQSPLQLFNPANVIVGQEDSFTQRLMELGRPPRICLHAFVYHAKSATVKVAGYNVMEGSRQPETRNNLQLYHPNINLTLREETGTRIHTKRATTLKEYFSTTVLPQTVTTSPDMSPSGRYFPDLLSPFPALADLFLHAETSNTPPNAGMATSARRVVTLAMATSDPVTSPTAGDIFTASELASNLQLQFRVRVVFRRRGVDWYDMSGVDVLVTFLDSYDLSLMHHEAPHLVKVAWMRNWFHRWMSQPWLGNYDLLLVSSGVAKAFFDESVNGEGGCLVQCHKRCPWLLSVKSHVAPRQKLAVPVEILRIATNPHTFTQHFQRSQSPLFPTSTLTTETNGENGVDFVFTGNYWNHSRDIMRQFQPDAPSLAPHRGWIVGSGWREAMNAGLISSEFEDMLRPPVPYRRIPEVYAAAKVVLDDSNHVTKQWGSVNSRVFDALAMGVLVITNGGFIVSEQ